MKVICISLSITCILYGWSPIITNTGREFQIIRHNINNVELCVSNYGKFGQDETGNNAGCWWPVGSGHSYIYGAGTWVGGIDSVAGDTLVTIGYTAHGGGGEYAPGLCGMSVSDPQAIIYFHPNPWPPPGGTFPTAPQTSLSHQDSWCVYNDSDSVYHVAGDTRPIGFEVYQSIHAWNLSLLIDVVFLTFEIKNVSGQNMTDFYLGICADNDIGNEAGNAANDLISAIVGQWYVIDGDSFWIDNLAYQWQYDEEPGTTPYYAAVIGYDLIRTPYDLVDGEDKDGDGILDQYERDSVYFVTNLSPAVWDVDHDGLHDWRDPSEIPQLGMTAFKRFTLNLEPNYDRERYMTLAGYNFYTGAYEPYDTFHVDPDDQRWLQASGPFELMPDSTVTLVLALVFADWMDIFECPDTALVEVDYWAQFCHDMNWFIPGPPPLPGLTLIPGDAKITLVWDNQPEHSADPWFNIVGVDPSSPYYDPFYRQYDFEGYRVWKSMTGQPGSWEMLASFDLSNDIAFTDTAFEPEPLEASNTGLSHIFVDEDVRNGFVYHYAVTSFDYNYVRSTYDSVFAVDSTTWYILDSLGNPIDTMWVYQYDTVEVYGPRAIWFESGFRGDSVRARRDPANYVPPSDPIVELVSGNEQLTELVDASVAYPQDINADYPLYIEYLAPDTATLFFTNEHNHQIPYTGGRYTALLKDDARVLDTVGYVVRIGSGYVPHEIVPPVNGMFINSDIGTPELPATFAVFDSVEIVSGSYPANYLVPSIPVPLPAAEDSADTVYMHGLWAWRGNDYQVVWRRKNPGSPVNTVEVTDLVTGELIPYRQYQNTPVTRHLAEGWCFTWHSPATAWSKPSHDTIQAGFVFPVAERTRYLYVNGGMLALRNNSYMYDTILPQEDETWVICANEDYLPPSVYGGVRITGTPGMFTDTAIALNVKVVPNPYIISNEWQMRFVQRRVKFINLPNRCTIRIFNLNGELVRTLLHQETSASGVSNDLGGDEWWNVLNDYDELVASGVYIFHVESDVGEQVGKFVIIN
jgi:hypothetical protein